MLKCIECALLVFQILKVHFLKRILADNILYYSNKRPLKCTFKEHNFPSSPVNMALLNTRSLSSKSFTLNYFFLFELFLTETWLNPEELTLANCTFYNSPRLWLWSSCAQESVSLQPFAG